VVLIVKYLFIYFCIIKCYKSKQLKSTVCYFMSTITDTNFTYSVISISGRTLAITGINPSNSLYSLNNASWGTFPAIPSVYAGSNATYNGNGVPANAYKVVEIGANAFDSLTAFTTTALTSVFLPANLKRIGDRAFANVKLSGTLTIPTTLDSVGFQAFYNTLITDIVIGSSTNSSIVAHLANLTSVIQQEINDRNTFDASLNLLKAPIDNPIFTGTASIPNANIGLATVSSASIATAKHNLANITSAGLNTLNVVGNATFAGSVSAIGTWNFAVKPKIINEVAATEVYVNDQIAAIAGPGLITALDTLTELASAIGGDSSFATNIINSHTSISTTLSNQINARSDAILALSNTLSTSASSLTVVDSALSTALSSEVSARTASVTAMSTALSTATSSLEVKNSAFSTALSTEISTRSTEISTASSTRSAAVSSFQLIDTSLSTALSTEVSTRVSAVASFVPVISASSASLSTVDVNAAAALSTETSTRVSAVASLNQLQTASFASLSGITSSLSTALSTEVISRTSTVSSLSASASVAAVSLQQTNTQFSIALAAEAGVRDTSVTSLSTSISASTSVLVSTNSIAVNALGTETTIRASVVQSASTSVTNAVSTISSSILAHSTAISAETSVRTSHIQSISTRASTAISSLIQANSAISTALIVEGTNRSTAVSTAIQNILSAAPVRFNTLEKIASEMSTNQSLTINASTMANVSTLRTAVSNETSVRISTVASLSNTAIPSLLAVDTSLINAISAETSQRGTAIASLSGALSSASVSFAAVNVGLSGALSTESVARNTAVGSVSTAVASVATVLGAADASLSTAISAETSSRVSAVASVSVAASQAFALLNASHAATSGAIVAEISTRVASIASVSGAITASFASLQTSNSALNGSVSVLSAALAPKATTAYLDSKITTLLNGAPSQLNTLAEMAAALGNNPNFASSISTALSTKGNATDASTVSLAIATKGELVQFNSLATVVSNKADTTALSTAITSVVSLNNTLNALSTAVSTVQATGGNVNGTTVAVSGVDIPTMAARIREFYYKIGTENPSWGIINADGTINYKVNRLANPSFVSSALSFTFDSNGAVTKITHLVTVNFDSTQTSATVTGGAGNPTVTVNNMVLDASNNYIFRIEYAGDASYYTTNKTAVSIVALETKYKLAPSAPTVSAQSLDISSYVSAAPTIVANSTSVSKTDNTYTYTATFTNADNAVMEVVNADNTVAAVQPTINVPYSYTYDSSKIGSTIFKIRVKNTASKLASSYVLITGTDIPPVISNFTLGAKALDESAIVLPQPTTTSPVTFAQTFSQVGQTILYDNSHRPTGYRDRSPVRISADGTKILIGGINDASHYGTLRMFSLDNNVWTQVGGDMKGNKAGGYMGVAVNSVNGGGEVMAMSADATLVVACDVEYYTPKNIYIFKYDPNKTAAPAKWTMSTIIDTSYVTGYGSHPMFITLSADGKVLAAIKNNSILIYKSTDGGVTWSQTGIINNSTGLPYSQKIAISANGSRFVVTEQADHSPIYVYEWNDSTWTSTTLHSSEASCYDITYDGNTVVIGYGGNGTIFFKRFYKNASGVWTGSNVLAFGSERLVNLTISGDGSTMIAIRLRYYIGEFIGYGIIDTYRWNGTNYVSVIPSSSIARGTGWTDYSCYAWINADGTRLIASSPRYNADVYDLAPSSKFSYTSSNSAVAEIYGNLALLKSVGTSTITATQIAPAGNATTTSDLTVVNTGIIPTGTLTTKYTFGTFGNAGTEHGLYNPLGVAINSSGNIVLADASNFRVKVHRTTDFQFISQITQSSGGFSRLAGVAAFMNGNIAVLDSGQVKMFTNSGTLIRTFGAFNLPHGIAIDHRNNNIVVTDTYEHRIQVFNENGTFIRMFGTRGSGNGELTYPLGVAVDLNGLIYIADNGNDRVQVLSETGTFIRKFGSYGTGDGQFRALYGIAVDTIGRIVTVELTGARIQVFDNNGNFLTKMVGFNGQYAAITPAGEIIVTVSGNNQVKVIG
jgi:hypothetical protein